MVMDDDVGQEAAGAVSTCSGVDNHGTGRRVAPQAGMVERADVTTPTVKITGEHADQGLAVAGVSGIRTATSRVNATSANQTSALRPAGTTTGDVLVAQVSGSVT